MKIFLLLALVGTYALAGPTDQSGKIAPSLRAKLQEGRYTTFNLIITMAAGTEEVLQAIDDTRFPSRDDRLVALGSSLQEHAASTQGAILGYLDSAPVASFRSLWLSNKIIVKGATVEVIFDLVKQYGNSIGEVIEDSAVLLDDPAVNTPIVAKPDDKPEWGIEKIQAVEANELLSRVAPNAEQVRIATIDTGVRVTHEALRDNYLGEYGWFDPYMKTPKPNDAWRVAGIVPLFSIGNSGAVRNTANTPGDRPHVIGVGLGSPPLVISSHPSPPLAPPPTVG
jgi:hypothetical protein